MRETLIDEVARAIYSLLPYDGPADRGKPEWVEHGNSHKQQECRNYSRAAIAVFARYLREPSEELKDLMTFKINRWHECELGDKENDDPLSWVILRALASHLEKEMG